MVLPHGSGDLYHKYRPRRFDEVVGHKEVIRSIKRAVLSESPSQAFLLVGDSGTGKCHGKGTAIRMFDGSIKRVEDVLVGDLLMGNDSTPREVLSLARGQDEMYEVYPIKGEPFTCNKEHILSLVDTRSNKITNISITNFIRKSPTFKSRQKLYKVSVNYPYKEVLIDPYFIGLWLGDGHTSIPAVTTMDQPIIRYIHEYAARLGVSVRKQELLENRSDTYVITSGIKSGSHSRNPLVSYMKHYGLLGSAPKSIPKDYLVNEENIRLQVLAGIIDTDGHLTCNCYEVITKLPQLADQYLELARSLGFQANYNIKEVSGSFYYRIYISGNIDKIPVRLKRKKASPRQQIKNHLRSGFSLSSLGVGNYYGFTLTGNSLYLLRDFTVTHNTTTARIMALTLNCESISEEGEPCLTCESCKTVISGVCTDIVEVNAADHRGIGDIRSLCRYMPMMPLQLRRKVFILDEAHQLTNDAQSSLLKELEEAPKHVFIILCSTHPKKILPTVKNRCQQFKFSSLRRSDMVRLLEDVATYEGQDLPVGTYKVIADCAEGSPRNGLVKLQQVIQMSPETLEDVSRLLETEDQNDANIFKLCFALTSTKKGGDRWFKIAPLYQECKHLGPPAIGMMIAGYFRNQVLKMKNTSNSAAVLKLFVTPFPDGKLGENILVHNLYEASRIFS